jgi:Mlc titration factor MtfA (ptsG expression regulator)
MLLTWLRKRRRRRLLRTPFPDAWLGYLHRNVGLYALLSPAEQARLRDDLRVFAAEKNWEGCGGLAMTDEVKVTVAAQACLLLLGLDHDYFGRVLSVLVYPSAYRAGEEREDQTGVVVEGHDGRLGEAWYRGPVVLGWDGVLRGGRNYQDGRNVVLHEFAHQLDFLDGYGDGTPPLIGRDQYRRWHEVMTTEYERLVAESEAGRATLLDAYGTTNPSEFFAVATECFFEQPVPLRRRHRPLYDLLREYYRQDPAERFERRERPEGRSPLG